MTLDDFEAGDIPLFYTGHGELRLDESNRDAIAEFEGPEVSGKVQSGGEIRWWYCRRWRGVGVGVCWREVRGVFL